MIEYRRANPQDARALARIRSIFLLEANNLSSESERQRIEFANLEYLNTALPNDAFIAWVAQSGEEIVATSGICFYMVPPTFSCPDGKVAYIMNMFTYPEYRKQGIAKVLLKKVIEEAKVKGYSKITLNATAMGRPLYEQIGFKENNGEMVLYI